MKGIKNDRPSMPRYSTTWDTDLVVNYLKEYDHSNLKNLTLKLTMILALITAQRAQTLSKLKLSEMTIQANGCIVFRIGEALKTKAPGTAVIETKEFKPDQRICAVTLIQDYISKPNDIREDDYLIISFVKPHRAVHVDTIHRWITKVMAISGVNTDVYKPHSTKDAATSKARARQVPLEQIMKAAMWSNSSTFATFYNKTIDKTDKEDSEYVSFQQAVLQ